MDQRRYLIPAEAAEYLKCSEAWLNMARHKGKGPQFIRHPELRRILYEREALDTWMSKGVRASTAEYPTPESLREKQSPGRPPNGSGTRKSKEQTTRGRGKAKRLPRRLQKVEI